MFNNTTLLLILSFVAIFPLQKANAIESNEIAATKNSVEISVVDSATNTDPNQCDRGSGRLHCYKTEMEQFNKERGSGRINTEETHKKSLHR
ncbi:MAG: hypothetical protein AAGA60_29935 [Cyanobacteria bacterium P01_E01_bin.42]